MKSPADVDKEGAILSEMLEIVEQKDSLRSMLEEDRQRWALFLNLIDWARGSLDGSEEGDDGTGGANEEEDEYEYDDVFYGSQANDEESETEEQQEKLILQLPTDEVVDNNNGNYKDRDEEEEFEELFGCSQWSVGRKEGSATREVSEFDRLVRELSQDSTTNNCWNPTIQLDDGTTVQLKDLVSAQELKMWVTNAMPTEVEEEEKDQMVFQLRHRPQRPQRSASLTDTSCEEFYQRRLAKPTISITDEAAVTIEKPCAEFAVVTDDADEEKFDGDKDWGSLGVRFENRGVVRDLVWQWEYNHLQQSGRLGAVPDADVGTPRPIKRRTSQVSDRFNLALPMANRSLRSASSSDLESIGQPNKKKKKKKTGKDESQSQESSKPMMDVNDDDHDNHWPMWQIGLLLWLIVFSIFVIYNLFFVSSWHPFFFF